MRFRDVPFSVFGSPLCILISCLSISVVSLARKNRIRLVLIIALGASFPVTVFAVNEPVSGWCQFKGTNSTGLSHAEAAADCADACTMDDITSNGHPRHRECTVIGSSGQGKTEKGNFYSEYVSHDLKLVTTEFLPNGTTAVTTISGNFFTSVQKFCIAGEIRDGSVCVTCPAGQEWDAYHSICRPGSENDPLCPIVPGSNPVNLATGNKHQVEVDIPEVYPRGIAFVRYYSSSAIYGLSTAFKGYWRHNYESSVDVRGLDDSVAYVTRPNGRRVRFNKSGGVWESSLGNAGLLEDILDDNNSVVGFSYKTLDNRTEIYNAQGFVASISDVSGYTLIFDYDLSADSGGDGFPYTLDRVSDSVGHALSFSYSGGRLSAVTDHNGRTYVYGYDANGRLSRVVFPDGTQKLYHYENAEFDYALTGVTDRRGARYATFEYDDKGRGVASYHGVRDPVSTNRVDGVSIVYDDINSARVVTDSNANSSTYETVLQQGVRLVKSAIGPACAVCGGGSGGAVTNYSYDLSSNNLLGKTEDGVATQYGNYDTKGQYGYRIEAVGAAGQRRTDYTYDPRFYNKVTRVIEPSVIAAEPTTQCVVGVDCKVTEYTYDGFGNRTAETITGYDPFGNTVSRTTRWTYAGPLHQLSEVDGPRTDVADITRYRYYPDDASVPVGSRARLREIEDASGVRIRSDIQYTAAGKVSSERRPNGLILTYTYYPGNDRLQTLTESGEAATRVTRWTYLASGEVQSVTMGDGTPGAVTLSFSYDEARRLVSITDALGNHLDYTLDTEGNRLAETTYDANGTPSDRADDLLRRQITRVFDVYNRVDTTVRANETSNLDFAPDGTLDRHTDGKGVITDYTYDALKRLIQVTRNLGSTDPSTADATTTWHYDVAGRLAGVTDPVGGDTSYAYDDIGNLLSQTSADTGTSTFAYDTAGNLIRKTDANGQVFTYSYDALNRLTAIDAPGTTDDITYVYDNCPGGVGRLCHVTYGNGLLPEGNQVHYWYNAFGDTVQHQGILYGYDAQGRVQTLDYPSGSRVTYRYDASGRVDQVDFSINGQSWMLASGVRYAPFGPVTGLVYGNGLRLNQTFDAAYRFTGQRVADNIAAPTVTVLDRAYPAYDANGNRLGQIDMLVGDSNFGYDALNRLATAAGPFGARGYTYDKNGNRIRLVADSITIQADYAPESNRLNTLGGADVLLDNNGNMLSQGLWTYAYNPHNRLVDAAENTTLKASFRYNGLGQRFAKTDETAAQGKYVLYGRNGERLVEADNSGNVLLEYLYLNGQLLAVYAPDDDRDGVTNRQAALSGTVPQNPDSDGDGLSNLQEWFQVGTDSQNPDSDGDGISDGAEVTVGTSPVNAAAFPGDGDINGNGEVNAGDLVLMTRMVLGIRVPTQAQFVRADMNQDGQLNMADLLLLQKKVLMAWLGIETGTSMEKAPPRIGVQPNTIRATALSALDWFIKPARAVPGNNGVLLYVHNDPLGTPQVLTDESGIIVWTAQYDPFGKATVDEDPDNDGSLVTLNVRFPGQYYDKETGLHYNYFRYYDPRLGRYLTSDPLGLAGGMNTYAYVLNNPINFYDPYGLFLCSLLKNLGDLTVDLDAGIGFGLGISGGLSLSSSGISGNVTAGSGIGLGASAGISGTANISSTNSSGGVGTAVTISGGAGFGGAGSINAGTGGVSATGTMGVGFGFNITSGFTVYNQILDCEEEKPDCN